MLLSCGGGTGSASSPAAVMQPPAVTPAPAPPVQMPTPAPSAPQATAPVPNRLTLDTLKRNALRIEVPAGEWRAVRFDKTLYADGVSVAMTVASEPNPQALPWIANGSQTFRDDGAASDPRGVPSRFGTMLFAGLRNQVADAFTFISSFSDFKSNEVVFVLGSLQAPAVFWLGVVSETGGQTISTDADGARTLLNGPADDPMVEQAKLSELQSRVALTPLMEQGRGGFGASYVRSFDASGRFKTFQAGPVTVSDSALASAPGAGDVERDIRVLTDVVLAEPGIAALVTFAAVQGGGARWDQLIDTVGFRRHSQGSYTAATGASTRTNTSEEEITAVGRLWSYITQPVQGGRLTLSLRHQFTGREGGAVAGNGGAVSNTVLSQTLAYWGYVNADFSALYGWQPTTVETYF